MRSARPRIVVALRLTVTILAPVIAAMVVSSLAGGLVASTSLDVQAGAGRTSSGPLPSGDLLAVSAHAVFIALDSRLEEWDRVTFARLASHALPGDAWAADPQGRRVLVRLRAGTPTSYAVVDVRTGTTLSRPALGNDRFPRFAPDGTHFVTQSGRDDHVITWWDAGSGRAVAHRAATPAAVFGFTADSRQVLIGTPSSVSLWTPASGRETIVATLGKGVTAGAAAVTPDGLRVITAGSDDLLKEWDIRTHSEIRTLGRQRATRDMALGPDGRLVAVGWWDSIAVWDHTAGTKVVELADGTDLGLRNPFFSPDGRQVFAQGRYGDVHAWDIRQVRLEAGTTDGALPVRTSSRPPARFSNTP